MGRLLDRVAVTAPDQQRRRRCGGQQGAQVAGLLAIAPVRERQGTAGVCRIGPAVPSSGQGSASIVVIPRGHRSRVDVTLVPRAIVSGGLTGR
jgi:hypothetical protein